MKEKEGFVKQNLEKLDKYWEDLEDLSETAIAVNKVLNEKVKKSRCLLREILEKEK